MPYTRKVTKEGLEQTKRLNSTPIYQPTSERKPVQNSSGNGTTPALILGKGGKESEVLKGLDRFKDERKAAQAKAEAERKQRIEKNTNLVFQNQVSKNFQRSPLISQNTTRPQSFNYASDMAARQLPDQKLVEMGAADKTRSKITETPQYIENKTQFDSLVNRNRALADSIRNYQGKIEVEIKNGYTYSPDGRITGTVNDPMRERRINAYFANIKQMEMQKKAVERQLANQQARMETVVSEAVKPPETYRQDSPKTAVDFGTMVSNRQDYYNSGKNPIFGQMPQGVYNFANEDLLAVATGERKEAKKNLDDLTNKIDGINSQIRALSGAASDRQYKGEEYYKNNAETIRNLMGQKQELEAQRAGVEQEYNKRRAEASAIKFESMARNFETRAKSDPEFEAYAQQGANTGNPMWNEIANRKINNKAEFAYTNKKMFQDLNYTGNANVPMDTRYAYLSDDERKTYNYYMAKYGTEKADEYFSSLKRYLDQRSGVEAYDRTQKFARENKAQGVAANLLSSLAEGASLIEGVKQNIQNKMTGEDDSINPYSPLMRASNVQSASREGVVGDIENPALRFLAETGLSIGQSVIKLPTGPIGAIALIGTSAAGNTIYEASKNGASAEQALKLGLTAGAVEVLTEKIPLDNLFRIAKAAKGASAASVKKIVADVLKQAGIEFTEETLSQYANTIANMSVMGDKSDFNQYRNQLIANGYSPEDAQKAAMVKYFVQEPFMAGIGGAVSGAVMGGGAHAFSASVNKIQNYANKNMPQNVISEIRQNGADIQEKLNAAAIYANKTPSASQQVFNEAKVEIEKGLERARKYGKYEGGEELISHYRKLSAQVDKGIEELSQRSNQNNNQLPSASSAMGNYGSRQGLISIPSQEGNIWANPDSDVGQSGQEKRTVHTPEAISSYAQNNNKTYMQPSDYTEIANTLDKAQSAQNKLNAIMKSVSDKNGLQGTKGNIKSMQSIVDKVNRKREEGINGYSASDIKDAARGTIFINNYNEAPKAVSDLLSAFGDTAQLEVKNDKQYFGIHVTGKINGMTVEVQVATPKAYEIKQQADEIYQKWRNVPQEKMSIEKMNEALKDKERSAKLYNGYFAELGVDRMALTSSIEGVLDSSSINAPQGPTYGTQEPSLNTNADFPTLQGDKSISNPPPVNLKSSKLSLDKSIDNTPLLNDNNIISQDSQNDNTQLPINVINDDAIQGMRQSIESNPDLILNENVDLDDPHIVTSVAFADMLSKRFGVKTSFYTDNTGRDGFYDPTTGTMHINTNAPEYMYPVIGHEFLHAFKSIDRAGYDSIRNYVRNNVVLGKNYAKYRAELLAARKENGINDNNKSGAEIDDLVISEMISDLGAEVLRDPSIIQDIAQKDISLSKRIMNTLQRIIDNIKEFFGVENGQITRLVNNFEESKKVYGEIIARSEGRVQRQPGEAEYAIRTLPDGRKYVEIERDIFDGVPRKERPKTLLNYMTNNFAGKGFIAWTPNPSTGKIEDWNNANVIRIPRKDEKIEKNYMINKSAYSGRKYTDAAYARRGNAFSNAGELIELSSFKNYGSDKDNKHLEKAKHGWEYRTAFFEMPDGKMYQAKLNIALGEENLLYDITNIDEVTTLNSRMLNTAPGRSPSPHLINNSIQQSKPVVNSSIYKNQQNDTEISQNDTEIQNSMRRRDTAQAAIDAYNNGDYKDLPTKAWSNNYVRDLEKNIEGLDSLISNEGFKLQTVRNEIDYIKAQPQTAKMKESIAELEQKATAIQEQMNKYIAKHDAKVKELEPAELLKEIQKSFMENSTDRFFEVADMAQDIQDRNKGMWSFKLSTIDRVFKHVMGKHYEHFKEVLLDPFDKAKGENAKWQRAWADRIYNEISKNDLKGKKERAAIQWLGEGERNPNVKKQADIQTLKNMGIINVKNLDPNIRLPYKYEDCVREFGEARAKQIKHAADLFREFYDESIDKINNTQRQIYPNRPEKLVYKRKDYFRHFQEINNDIKGLQNVIQKDNNISPELVSISEFTKPKEKWASIKQERVGKATDEDAISGFLDYLPQAGYAIYINPYIDKFRGLARDIAEAKQQDNGNTNANSFIAWLNEYANKLAGKSSKWERALLELPGGRTTLKTINWINNRTKVNMIVGNVSTVIAQPSNIANGIALLKNPLNIGHGITATVEGFKHDSEAYKNMQNSAFLSERFLDDKLAKFQSNFDPFKHAGALLSLADGMGARVIWNAAYYEAVQNKVADPFKYADDLTRKAVGGRGIGEVPLALQSSFGKMIMPFMVEVNNNWDMLFNDIFKGAGMKVGEKTARAIMLMVLYNIYNRFTEMLRGSRVNFDPIAGFIEGVQQGIEEGDNLLEQIGFSSLRALQNIAGDAISNSIWGPMIQTAGLISEDATRTLFNDSLYPARGVNVPALQSIGKSVEKGLKGDYVGAGAEIATSFVTPWGGKQLDKTVRGLSNFMQGGIYENDIYKQMSTGETGKLKYLVEPTPENFIKAVIMGPSSLKNSSAAKTISNFETDRAKIYSAYYQGKDQDKLKGNDVLGYNRYSSVNSYLNNFDKMIAEAPDTETRRSIMRMKNDVINSIQADEDLNSSLSEIFNETKDESIMPFSNLKPEIAYSDGVTDANIQLSADEYRNYIATIEEKTITAYKDILKDSAFGKLSAEDKAKKLKSIKDDVREQASIDLAVMHRVGNKVFTKYDQALYDVYQKTGNENLIYSKSPDKISMQDYNSTLYDTGEVEDSKVYYDLSDSDKKLYADTFNQNKERLMKMYTSLPDYKQRDEKVKEAYMLDAISEANKIATNVVYANKRSSDKISSEERELMKILVDTNDRSILYTEPIKKFTSKGIEYKLSVTERKQYQTFVNNAITYAVKATKGLNAAKRAERIYKEKENAKKQWKEMFKKSGKRKF